MKLKALGEYNTVRLIGSGGMSAVYEAEHTFLKKRVAVKVLNKDLAVKPDFRERFRNEALIMAKLDHPNIAGIIDFIEEEDVTAIVMEYVKGITLDEYVVKKNGLDRKEAIDIQKTLLNAFAHAHHQGVVHRDVKPSNIIIDPDKGNFLKILDFGIAKVLDGDSNLTGTGMQMGTPMYMSPDQVKDSKHIDHRSDIYSLGVLFYFLITGKKPYNVSTLEIYSKILNEALPQIVNYPELNAVVQKAAAKDPDKRFQSCEEFVVKLDEFSIINTETVVDDNTMVENGNIHKEKSPQRIVITKWQRLLSDVKKYSKPVSEKLLIDKSWMVDNSGIVAGNDIGFYKLIFERNLLGGTKRLLLFKEGKVTEGTWQYMKDAKVLLLKDGNSNTSYSCEFIDDAVVVLKKDGTYDSYVMFANEKLLPERNVYLYLLKIRNERLNIERVSLTDGRVLEVIKTEGNYIYGGEKVSFDGEDVPDGVYEAKDKLYKFVIKDSKIKKLFYLHTYDLKGGGEIIIEQLYSYAFGYENGETVLMNGKPAADGEYKINGGNNIVVKDGVIEKRKWF